jgi:hypothetical protein
MSRVEDRSDGDLLEPEAAVLRHHHAQIHNRYTWFRYAMKSRPNSDA